MILLKTFASQLAACGDLKRVWLTSFNIDIEFIETYILPTVLGAEIPRTRMDYEALQLELNERGIDFRVFCDKRFISPDQNKRTLIPVHGISPSKKDSEGSGIAEMGFNEESLFHAKVIYIEGKDGRVLGSGSANLTVSGWGRNREVFQFVPLDEEEMYHSAWDFFHVLFQNVGENFPLVKKRKFDRTKPRARFCHSFQDVSFLNQLLGEWQHPTLAVWSPYLSKDLAALIDTVRTRFEQPDIHVHLVADRVEGRYLRTAWSEALQALVDDEALTFYQFPVAGDERITMTHAKLWKTDSHLAIGSWNFTGPGANTAWGIEDESAQINIEAGLIFADKSDLSAYLGLEIEVVDDLFATESELKAEALDVPEALPFDLRVEFHWGRLTYSISGVWNRRGNPESGYSVKLPSMEQPVELRWMPKARRLEAIEISISDTRNLLTEHRYAVFREGKSCGTGLLIETAVTNRRAQQYGDLKSLLDAMAHEGAEPSLDDADFRVWEEENGEIQVDRPFYSKDDSQAEDASSGLDDISYFRLFAATFQYAAQLRGIQSMRGLEQWGFTRPGCLEELVVKTRERIENAECSVFNWFLAMEVNELCELARRCRKALIPADESIHLSRWNDLNVAIPGLPEKTDNRYRALLLQEYKGMRRSWGIV
ncbi:hypothetical protein [Alcanivorax sp.]|uniref:hypothetical protein n=1 Tax=Alcanivorax sp. TaxID=1872427 RepID=UPI0025B81714|nr:hypothetical protein [Alcanivorax sp.]